jgi:cohesin complex subunit SA-1/2
LKILTDIYLLSTDEQVMMNCARSIRFLSEGDHARSTEAKRGVKKLVSTIRDKVLEHLSSQQEETNDQNDKSKDAGRTSSRGKSERQGTGLLVHDSDDEDMLDDASSRKIDNETSLYLNLQRARILSWQGIYSNFLNSDDDSSVEDMCNFVANGLSYRLSTFQVDSQLADDDDTADKTTDKRWDFSNDRIPCVTAGTVDEGLRFLLAVTAQKLGDTQNDEKLVLDDGIEIITNPDEEEEADEIEVDDHIVLRHRNRLLSLVDRCFQNFIDEDSGIEYTSAEKLWSTRIQESGGEIASDLRTLFPREWSNSSSSLLRSLAITDDSRLIGGYVRYLNTLQETNGDDSNISSLLLSNARAVCANWKQGNRREAGLLLSHITSSDTRAVDIVEALFNLLKAIVRFLCSFYIYCVLVNF